MKTIKKILFLVLAISLCSCHNTKQNQVVTSESVTSKSSFVEGDSSNAIGGKTKALDKEQLIILQKINEMYPEIMVTDLVLANTDKQSEEETLLFERDSSDFYFGVYVEYLIQLKDQQVVLNLDYNYSAGQAYSAIGHITYNKLTHDIIKTEYNYGTGSGTTEIYINGKSILKKMNDLNKNEYYSR